MRATTIIRKRKMTLLKMCSVTSCLFVCLFLCCLCSLMFFRPLYFPLLKVCFFLLNLYAGVKIWLEKTKWPFWQLHITWEKSISFWPPKQLGNIIKPNLALPTLTSMFFSSDNWPARSPPSGTLPRLHLPLLLLRSCVSPMQVSC